MFYRKIANVFGKKICGSWTLIKEGNNHYIELNDTAGFLWKHLDTPVSLEKLSELLSREFDAPLSQASIDTKEFIDLLTKEKMIEVVK